MSSFINRRHKFKLLFRFLAVLFFEGIQGVKKRIKGMDSFKKLQTITQTAAGIECHPKALELFYAQQKEMTTDKMEDAIKKLAYKPLFSIIMPVYNTNPIWLKAAIESVKKQIYDNWELCIVNDCSTDKRVDDVIKKEMNSDKRIKIKILKENHGISGASNIALNMAEGEYIALVDHDDEITPDALFWIVTELNYNPKIDFFYSDECKIDNTTQRVLCDFFFKPDWSPEFMLNNMYTGHLSVYRKSLVLSIGGFRSKYDFSQDYDLALRIAEETNNISHIERVLYLWRKAEGSGSCGGKPFSRISNLKALRDMARRRSIDATIIPAPACNYLRVNIRQKEKVSIIIPTDSYRDLSDSINSILINTAYPDYEIVVVCNAMLAKEIENEFTYCTNLILSIYDGEYNFSAKCNQGASAASGSILIFLNDDVRPIGKDWIETTIEYLSIFGVGGVSPRLVFEDGTIQYAGMTTGVPSVIWTPWVGQPIDPMHNDTLCFANWVRDVLILNGACLAIKKNIFEEIGRFDAINTPKGHSDADLSFRIQSKGYRCVFTPHASLTHIGRHRWHSSLKKDKSDIYLLKRWGNYLTRDPYFTNSMKQTSLFSQFPFEYEFYCNLVSPNHEYKGNDVLFILHELSLTGAPRVVYYAALAILESGGFPVILSAKDGPMKMEFADSGIPVVVNTWLFIGYWDLTTSFARNFDLVIATTLVCAPLIDHMRELNIVWWVHEGKLGFENAKYSYTDFRKILKNAENIYVGSHYCTQFLIQENPKYFEKILLYGIPDTGKRISNGKHEKIVFTLAGSIEPRKGQSIFISAIKQISIDLREKAIFQIVGTPHVNNEYCENYFRELIEQADEIKEITFIGQMSNNKLHELFSKSDVIVSSSIDDPMPIVITQAMMQSKTCICSSMTGSASFIKDGRNGFIFRSEDVNALKEKLIFIIEHPDCLERIGGAGRKLYESNFTMKVFQKNLLHIIDTFVVSNVRAASK
jgi:GT2 family glycosyltransferase